jgi:hypothetical protein
VELRELIQERKRGRSYFQLEVDGGHVLKAARWHQIATGQLRDFPAPRSVAAMANALGVSQETVILAAAKSLGLETRPRSVLAELLPDTAAELPDACVSAILDLIRAMCAMQGAAR